MTPHETRAVLRAWPMLAMYAFRKDQETFVVEARYNAGQSLFGYVGLTRWQDAEVWFDTPLDAESIWCFRGKRPDEPAWDEKIVLRGLEDWEGWRGGHVPEWWAQAKKETYFRKASNGGGLGSFFAMQDAGAFKKTVIGL